jgi:hypothetical protein
MPYYTDAEWLESAKHRPLKDRKDLLLLHRAFIWADLQRECADKELLRIAQAQEDFAKHTGGHSVLQSHLCAWYSFLFSVIEACLSSPGKNRAIDLRGVLREEIIEMKETLKDFRNSVFHVPPKDYYDERLVVVLESAYDAARIRRVHDGFARLFHEELAARKG